MEKLREAIQEKLEKVKKLEDLAKALKSGKELKGYLKTLSQEKGAPKNVDACKAQIAKLRERVQKEEMKMQAREDNKSVALGTSRINYMDPRITISWCKMKDVPIEKIFQSNLQAKFNWAMNNDPEWQF
uniref:Topoisomerase I C-terminal domain-containing protein n=1 Tax=Favella ehrenbergii TaxID=182087 RepID=A0A7S3I7F4_9SPIT|mmetsp:Transcript_4823/g.5872  ORF Transcript_4823/g.5872 Transcript_4823/m.5872 type:complete len:129 (+) Transcript_4823:704-1090(+)